MTTLTATPFGFTSTAAEILDGVDLSDKRAVVTGAASGIGIETARALAGAGAALTLAVRDVARGGEVAADIAKTTGNDQVAVGALELTDPASIDAFAGSWTGPLQLKDSMPTKSPEQGAATSVLLAGSPLVEGISGRYFEDVNEAEVIPERGDLGARGVAPYALDPANVERLWELSESLLG
jgi:hypothetical protein